MAVLAALLFSVSPLGAQESTPASTDRPDFNVATPFLILGGMGLMTAGGLMWYGGDGSLESDLPGMAMFGAGLAFTITGLVLGGTDNWIAIDVRKAIQEGAGSSTPAPASPQPSPSPSPAPGQ